MNRTLLDKIICMYIYSCLSKSFLDEAMMIISYLVNKCPFVVINFKMLEAIRTRRLHDYFKPRIFGGSTKFTTK